jgi:hypothetical protein
LRDKLTKLKEVSEDNNKSIVTNLEANFTTSKKIQVEKDLAGKKAFSECTVFEKTINSLDDQR